MFIALVVFEPSSENAEANAVAVRDVLDRIVAKQPGFIRARLHSGTGPTEGILVNYMEWESQEAFQAFRERHGPEVTEAVGSYNPRFNFLEVVHEIGAWTYKNVA